MSKKAVDKNVGGGVDRSKLDDSDFVFQDSRTFPVVTPGDVSDAVSSWGRYKGPHSFEEFKRRLIALCRRKGDSFVAALPDEWKDEMEGKAAKAQADDGAGGHGNIAGLAKHLSSKYGAEDKGWFTRCMAAEELAEYEHDTRAAICARAHYEAIGKWPGEKPPEGKSVKAAGDWELDVLAVPFGSAENRDADGQWFDGNTKLHEDKWPLPPVVYYHGFGPDKRPMGTPEYIGKAVRRWADVAGVWMRVVLDRTNAFAKRVWDAAQQGVARASSGSAVHLKRIDASGHITEWPVVELSIFDATDGREPANRYAVAIPALKAVYESAGLTLPEDFDVPGADPGSGPPEGTAARGDTNKTGVEAMEKTELEKLVADQIAAGFKAQADAAKAKADAEAAQQAAIDAAVKKAKDEWEAAAAKAGRLPLSDGAPYVRQYAEAAKYERLSLAEHAFLLAVMESAKHLPGNRPPSDAAVKTFGLRLEAEEKKDIEAALFVHALKAAGIKANDLNYATYSGYGSQWVGVQYSQQLWEAIRAECWVLKKLSANKITIPDGFSSTIMPLESTDPTFYKVAEATAETSGKADVTVTGSKIATANKTITVAKMGARVPFSGEMVEDSLIPWVANAMRQIKAKALEELEHVIIDGDTDATASTNINDIASAVAGTETFLLVDGFRKLPLITNTANSRSAGALDEDDFLETMQLLGTAGINAEIGKCGFIVDMPTYWKSLKLANLKTKDVWTNATLEKGQLTGIWGYDLKPSAFQHAKSTVRKANTAGKVDQDVTANNVTGSILAVRWDQWLWAEKRLMTIETTRYPRSDSSEIVALMRFGLAYRDTEASAISYGVTGV